MFYGLTHQSTADSLAMGLAEDRSTLDRLVREQLPAALRFAVRLTGDLDTAEDIVQEALLRAARSWSTFRGEAQFRTWLFRIVINAFRDCAHARDRPVELPEDVRDDRSSDPAEAVEFRELGELVAGLIAQLPPRQREVLVLMTYEGLGVHEVGEILGINPGNVRTNLHLARERLRLQLAPYLAEK
jgi:RNA polymerase sigma-70 factor, ECF subfamily